METSARAPLNGHMSQTYFKKRAQTESVCREERTLTPSAPVRPYALTFMELNLSDRGEGEVQSRESLIIRGEVYI